MNTKNAKKGFTLIELLITVALFTVVITIAVGGFTNAIRTQREVSSLISAQSNVSIALEQMTRAIRTGYLFCHAPGSTTYSPLCSSPSGKTCTVDNSSGAPVWTCPALDFYSAEGQQTNYSLDNGALTQNGVAITGNTVSVKYLQFTLAGQLENDHWPPRITISLGIAPSSSDPAVSGDIFNLETSVSARTIDCVPNTNPAQC